MFLKEIEEQPAAFQRAMAGRIKEGKVRFDDFALSKEDIEKDGKGTFKS